MSLEQKHNIQLGNQILRGAKWGKWNGGIDFKGKGMVNDMHCHKIYEHEENYVVEISLDQPVDMQTGTNRINNNNNHSHNNNNNNKQMSWRLNQVL